MNSKLKKNDLEDFVVRLEYQKDDDFIERASGVVVKVNDTLIYILTVKHFLQRSYNQPISSIEESVDIDKLALRSYRLDEIVIEKAIFLKNKELDILILKVDTISLNLFSTVKCLEIFMDDFHQCAIFGYPRSREKTTNSLVLHASHPDKIDLDENSFEIKSDINLHSFEKSETDNIKGLSGAGVFIKGKSGKVYLVGIQYQYMDMTYLKSINLRSIKKEIDNVIDGEIPISEYPFFEEIGVDISKITFDSLDEHFSMNKEVEKFKKRFSKNRDKELWRLEKDYIEIKGSMRKVADRYFFLGKESFDTQNLSKAYLYFSRAIELFPSYKHFFANSEFAKNHLSKEEEEARYNLDNDINLMAESSFLEELLEKEERFLIKKNDTVGLEKLYEKLIQLSSKGKEKIIGLWLKLSKIKFSNNKVKEAENILINLRDEVDDELLKEKINQELLIIYVGSLDNESISRDELLQKILLLEKELKDKSTISINYIIEELKEENYYLNDCLIDHISNQKNRIHFLEYRNSQLKLDNENYFKQINYNPSFVLEKVEKSNTKILSLSLLVIVLGIVLSLEYLHCPVLDWIESLNIKFLK
jgi:hypothetical protein